jgi:hypothetical protein
MARRELPSQEKLQELFEYKDGQLLWKVRQGRGKKGASAGCFTNYPYKQVRIDGVMHSLHRLIFVYHHGYCPDVIDHADGNALNNDILNLREATQSENCLNKKLSATSSTKIKNVCWYSKLKRYRVGFEISGKYKHFGYYEDIELAELVAIEARNKYCGQFAHHG